MFTLVNNSLDQELRAVSLFCSRTIFVCVCVFFSHCRVVLKLCVLKLEFYVIKKTLF